MRVFLQTERLVLRRLKYSDAKNLFALDNNRLTMRYISTAKSTDVSLKQCRTSIRKQRAYYKAHPGLGIYATVEKHSGRFIGWMALKDLDGTDDVELGYRFLPSFWGKGYATEASAALLHHGFNTLGLKQIVAIALAQNKASTHVMQKVGMQYIKDAFYYNTNVVLYGTDKPLAN